MIESHKLLATVLVCMDLRLKKVLFSKLLSILKNRPVLLVRLVVCFSGTDKSIIEIMFVTIRVLLIRQCFSKKRIVVEA